MKTRVHKLKLIALISGYFLLSSCTGDVAFNHSNGINAIINGSLLIAKKSLANHKMIIIKVEKEEKQGDHSLKGFLPISFGFSDATLTAAN